jgi:hypothetical protein
MVTLSPLPTTLEGDARRTPAQSNESHPLIASGRRVMVRSAYPAYYGVTGTVISMCQAAKNHTYRIVLDHPVFVRGSVYVEIRAHCWEIEPLAETADPSPPYHAISPQRAR